MLNGFSRLQHWSNESGPAMKRQSASGVYTRKTSILSTERHSQASLLWFAWIFKLITETHQPVLVYWSTYHFPRPQTQTYRPILSIESYTHREEYRSVTHATMSRCCPFASVSFGSLPPFPSSLYLKSKPVVSIVLFYPWITFTHYQIALSCKEEKFSFFKAYAILCIWCLCCCLYWDAVGYVTKPVHCLTLNRGRLADSGFGATKGEQAKLYSRVNTKICTNVIHMTDSVIKVNL